MTVKAPACHTPGISAATRPWGVNQLALVSLLGPDRAALAMDVASRRLDCDVRVKPCARSPITHDSQGACLAHPWHVQPHGYEPTRNTMAKNKEKDAQISAGRPPTCPTSADTPLPVHYPPSQQKDSQKPCKQAKTIQPATEDNPTRHTHLSHECIVSWVVRGLDMSLHQPVNTPLDQRKAVVPLASTVGAKGRETGQRQRQGKVGRRQATGGRQQRRR
jgi:hypothetical protein